MPHAAIYWCNMNKFMRDMLLISVSMPHAAIYWCNEYRIQLICLIEKFQCRTRQFTGAMIVQRIDEAKAAMFQCRTRQFTGAMNNNMGVAVIDMLVSMPHAAIYWCNLISSSSRSGLVRFNAARGNLLVQ